MTLSFDPRGAALESFLRSLTPRAELIRRLMFRAISLHCRGDRAWNARTDALLAELDPDGSRLPDLLTESGDVERRLIREMDKSLRA